MTAARRRLAVRLKNGFWHHGPGLLILVGFAAAVAVVAFN